MKECFSFQFKLQTYRLYLDVMRQSACLVFNPIMIDNNAVFFNCTPVGRTSDSIYDGPDKKLFF